MTACISKWLFDMSCDLVGKSVHFYCQNFKPNLYNGQKMQFIFCEHVRKSVIFIHFDVNFWFLRFHTNLSLTYEKSILNSKLRNIEQNMIVMFIFFNVLQPLCNQLRSSQIKLHISLNKIWYIEMQKYLVWISDFDFLNLHFRETFSELHFNNT